MDNLEPKVIPLVGSLESIPAVRRPTAFSATTKNTSTAFSATTKVPPTPSSNSKTAATTKVPPTPSAKPKTPETSQTTTAKPLLIIVNPEGKIVLPAPTTTRPSSEKPSDQKTNSTSSATSTSSTTTAKQALATTFIPKTKYTTLVGTFGTNPENPIKFLIKGSSDYLKDHGDILGLWVKGPDGQNKYFPTYSSTITQRTNQKNSYCVFEQREGSDTIEVPAYYKQYLEFVTRIGGLYEDHQIPRPPQETRQASQGFLGPLHHPTAYLGSELDFYLDPKYSFFDNPQATKNIAQLIGLRNRENFNLAIQEIKKLPVQQRPTTWLRERVSGKFLQSSFCFFGTVNKETKAKQILDRLQGSWAWDKNTNNPFANFQPATGQAAGTAVGEQPPKNTQVPDSQATEDPVSTSTTSLPSSKRECVHQAIAKGRTSRRSLNFKFRECKFCPDCKTVEKKKTAQRLRKPVPSAVIKPYDDPITRAQHLKRFNRIRINLGGILGAVGNLSPTKGSDAFIGKIIDRVTGKLLTGQLVLVTSDLAEEKIKELPIGTAKLAAISVRENQATILTTLTHTEEKEEKKTENSEVILPGNYRGPISQKTEYVVAQNNHSVTLEFERHKAADSQEEWELKTPNLRKTPNLLKTPEQQQLWRDATRDVEVRPASAITTNAQLHTRSHPTTSQSVDASSSENQVEPNTAYSLQVLQREIDNPQWLINQEGLFLATISRLT